MEPSLENLKPLIRCPVCQKRNEPGKAVVLSHSDGKTTIHLSCESCEISSLVFISIGKTGAVSFGVMTDLGREEAKMFYGGEAVSSDDALEVYRILRDFQGSIGEYLSR